jgi:hypothetical protein
MEQEMREWLLECFSDEYDQERILELTYEQLEKAINRYFDGGMEEFKACVGGSMKQYHQFVLHCEGVLPFTSLKKYRSYDRALERMKEYVALGMRGHLVTMSSGGVNGYGYLDSKEF